MKALQTIIFSLFLTASLFAQEEIDTIEDERDIDALLESIDEEKEIEEAKKRVLTVTQDEDIKFYTKKVLLKDAVLRALENSYNVKSSVEEVKQMKSDYLVSKSNFYPTVSTSASGAYVDKNEDSTLEQNTEATFKISASQNLYAGGATLATFNETKRKYVSKVKKHKGLVEKEINKAVTAYMDVVFAKESLNTTKEYVSKLKEILELVEIKYENGSINAGDLNAIKAGVANAEVALVRADSKYLESLDYYEYSIGRLHQSEVPFESNISINLDSLNEVLAKAEESNSLFLADLLTLQSRYYQLKSVNAEKYPSVDLKVTYTDTEIRGDSPSFAKELNTLLKVSYDLYDGNQNEYKRLKTVSTISELKYQIEEKRKKLRWDVNKLYKSITSSTSSIMSNKMELIANTKVVSSYWDEFKLGSKDLQTLLNAQKQLNTSQDTLIRYRRARIIDYFNLLEKTGTILEYFDIPFFSKYGTLN